MMGSLILVRTKETMKMMVVYKEKVRRFIRWNVLMV